jgi:hypothetical protein
MDNSKHVFSGKSFDSLMKNIYENSTRKSRTIEGIIDDLRGLVKNKAKGSDIEPSKVLIIYPMIKDFIDTSIKNDNHLLSLATIFQRIAIAELRDQGDDGWLNEEAIKSLQAEASEMADRMKAGAGLDVDDVISIAKKKLSDDDVTD